MNQNWQSAVVRRLLLLSGICLLVGLALGQVTLTLLFGTIGYIIWTLKQMFRLHQWLELSKDADFPDPPTSTGIWGELFDSAYRLQRRQKKTRGRLQAVIDRIQSSTSALSDAVVMINGQGLIEWWNPAAEHLLGLRLPDDRGQPVTNLVRDPQFIAYFEQASFHDPLELPSPLMEEIRLQYSITLYGTNNRMLIVRDVTRLYQLEQMRKDFIANVSHELKTPLTVITGYLETMHDSLSLMPDKAPPVWMRALGQMQQQSKRMQDIISDLLLLSRLETTDSQQDQKAIALKPLLKNIVNDARDLSGEKGHTIELSCSDDAYLLGSERELHSAIANLAYNAVNYTPVGGTIKLKWHSENSFGLLSVQDNGVGIEAQHIPRLTERFYRVDKSRNSNTGGTGLGLAIVKHILLRHGANLSIYSKPGKGSRFVCQFPHSRLLESVA